MSERLSRVLADASTLGRDEKAILVSALALQLREGNASPPVTGLAIEDAEEALFQEFRHRAAGEVPGLCLDGIPDPRTYRKQAVRLVFVFKEPNLLGSESQEQDIREMLRDRASYASVGRVPPKDAWWDRKVAMFVLAWHFREQPDQGWSFFEQHRDPSALLLNHGYVELKKSAGGGSANAALMKHYVSRDKDLLRRQFETYMPTIIVACGKSTSPAQFIASSVLQVEPHAEIQGRRAWSGQWSRDRRYLLLETLHPSFRRTKDNSEHAVYTGLARTFKQAAAELAVTAQ